MNNKGFTLVELLGVIAILAIIGAIVFPIVSNVINKGLDDTDDAQIKSIEKAAENWANANMFILPKNNGEFTNIKVEKLQKEGYLEDDCIKNPKVDNDDECSYNNACVKIEKIEKEGDSSNPKYKFTFEPDSSKCS